MDSFYTFEHDDTHASCYRYEKEDIKCLGSPRFGQEDDSPNPFFERVVWIRLSRHWVSYLLPNRNFRGVNRSLFEEIFVLMVYLLSLGVVKVVSVQ